MAEFPSDPIIALYLQIVMGGLLVLPLVGAQVIWDGIGMSDPPLSAYTGMAWLILAGIANFQAFNWLNRYTSSALANTFAYVAPVIALALGALFLGESVTLIKIGAALVTLVGVAQMVSV